eukprot:g75122.t1
MIVIPISSKYQCRLFSVYITVHTSILSFCHFCCLSALFYFKVAAQGIDDRTHFSHNSEYRYPTGTEVTLPDDRPLMMCQLDYLRFKLLRDQYRYHCQCLQVFFYYQSHSTAIIEPLKYSLRRTAAVSERPPASVPLIEFVVLNQCPSRGIDTVLSEQYADQMTRADRARKSKEPSS